MTYVDPATNYATNTAFFEGEEMYWREAENLRLGRNRYFNSAMFDEGKMTAEQAEASGVAIETAKMAQAARVTPSNPMGDDLSDPTYKAFFESFNLDERGKVVGTNWTPFELYDSAQRSGGVWAGEAPEGAMAGELPSGFAGSNPNNINETIGGMDVGGERVGFLGGGSTDVSKGAFVERLGQIGIPNNLANTLWEWAQEKLLDASYPLSNIAVDDQPAFKERFPAIEKMRDDDVSPVSPAEYIQYEKDVMGYLSQYGIQGQAFDFDTLITNLLVNHVGTGEVSLRLQEAKKILGNVPAAVKQTYADWFGPEVAEGNLMLTFIDPTDDWGGNWADVQANVATAEIGGWAKTRLNLEQDELVSQDISRSISELGLSQSAIWERLDQLNNRSALFAERIGEQDLEISQEGLQEKFGLTNSDLVERSQREREALFKGRTGVFMSGTGSGLGSSNA